MAHPPTESITLREAIQQFRHVVDRVFRWESHILMEKSDIPVAALVSIDDLRRPEQFDAEWARDFAVFDEVGAAFADATLEEIDHQAAVSVAQARAELRAEHEAPAER